MLRKILALTVIAASLNLAQPAYADSARCNVGIVGGYSAAGIEVDAGPLSIDSLQADGFGVGVTAGCDYLFGRFLVGVAAEYQWHDADFSVSSFSISMDNSISAVGRFGYQVTDASLVYGLGGMTRIETSLEDMDGWTAGAGMETDIGRGVVAGLEYRYSDFGSVSLGSGASADVDMHAVRAVLKYRFFETGK